VTGWRGPRGKATTFSKLCRSSRAKSRDGAGSWRCLDIARHERVFGRHDINVSSEVAAEWFASVKAPSKQLIWFERSGHHVTSEEPSKLLTTLVTYARPIAAKAGDVAP